MLCSKEINNQLIAINENLQKIANNLQPKQKPKITITKKELELHIKKHAEKIESDKRRLKERTLWQKFTGYIPDDIEAW
jgi:hypothetical protein